MRLSKVLVLCGLAGVLQFALAGTALAHHPNIEAEGYCDIGTGEYMIDWRTYSWCTDDSNTGCSNSDITVFVNGFEVGSGVYASPDYGFSGTTQAPEGFGATVSVQAGVWDNGYAGGTSASVAITWASDPACEMQGGRFTGGGHQWVDEYFEGTKVKVTRGLTIHCDLLLSNNLEVNWVGSKFHMTEHMVTVKCIDDPSFDPTPPAAPIDTLVGIGTGRYNGEYGYTIAFTLEDHGEPGTSDRMGMLIYQGDPPAGPGYVLPDPTDGSVVLYVELQELSGGNLQAHYDQPHK